MAQVPQARSVPSCEFFLCSERDQKERRKNYLKSVLLLLGKYTENSVARLSPLSALQARAGTTRRRRPGVVPSKGYEPKYVIRPRPDVREVFKTAVIEE